MITRLLAAALAASAHAGFKTVTPSAPKSAPVSGVSVPQLPSVLLPSLPQLSAPSLPQLSAPSLPQLSAPSLPQLPQAAQSSIRPSAPNAQTPRAAAAAPQSPMAADAGAPLVPQDAGPEAQSAQGAREFDGASERQQGAADAVRTAAPAAASPAGAAAANTGVELPVKTFKLKNGLTVVVSPDHASPMTAVSITYKVGSQHERRGRSGFAHLFEHLMAQGTKSIKPREISKLIEGAGGVRNAYTTRTNTTYHSLVPKGALEMVLWAEAERMHTLNVDARALAMEQQVVLEEMRLRYLNAPYRKAQDQGMAEALFEKWENRHTTIGEKSDIENAELADVRAFYETHYAPNNAVLSISGDVTVQEAEALAQKYFGAIPAKALPAEPDLTERPLSGEKRVTIEDPLAQTPRLMMAWHAPARATKDFWAMMLLAEMLSGTETNPLYQAVVKSAKAAYEASSNFPWWSSHVYMHGPDAFGLVINPRADKSVDEVLASVDGYLTKLVADGPSSEELERAKAQTRLSWVRELEQLLERATLFGSYAAFVGDPAKLAADLATLTTITAQDMQEAARRWLLERGRAVVSVVPGPAAPAGPAETQPKIPDAAPRAPGETPPAVAATAAAAPPALEKFTLSNGLNVVVVEDARLPIVEARMSIDAGRASERPGEEGLSLAASGLLLKGAGGRDAASLGAAFSRLGWALKLERGEDAVNVTAAGLSENAAAFFKELAAVLAGADYPQAELELWKEKLAQRLKDMRSEPDFMGDEALKKRILAGHPYGKPALQDDQLAAVTQDRVRRFFGERYKPAGATLVISGAIKASDAKALLESALASWTGSAASRPAPSVPLAAQGGLELVDRPGSRQANLVIAQTTPLAPTDDDFLAFAVMNQILGGSATSRLFVNLRVEKAYTYGSYSSNDAHPAGSIWQAEAQVRNEVAQAALDEMRKEIARMRDELVPEETLAATKRYLAGVFLMRLSSLDRVSDYLSALIAQGRDPETVIAEYLARLERLTPADLQAAARKYLDPSKMTTVVVGDAASLSQVR